MHWGAEHWWAEISPLHWCSGALVDRAPSTSQPSSRAMFTASPLSSLKPNLALSLAITLLELAASSWPAPVIPP